MKKLNFYILATILFPIYAQSSNICEQTIGEEVVEEQLEISTNVPNHLKGATIIIRLADGTESSVTAEKFKVVPRIQQFIVTKTAKTDVTVCKNDFKKNRVSIHAGNGPKEGLKSKTAVDSVEIESRVGAIGGVQYQRLVTDKVSIGAQIQTNESVLIGIGLDF